MIMIIVWALSWWYSSGWKSFMLGLRERLAISYDYFSIGLLITSLFAPFRQISAGRVRGSFDVVFRAFIDRLISRIIGAFVRSMLIIVGVAWLCIQVVIYAAATIGWALVPVVPLIGFVAFLSGRTIV